MDRVAGTYLTLTIYRVSNTVSVHIEQDASVELYVDIIGFWRCGCGAEPSRKAEMQTLTIPTIRFTTFTHHLSCQMRAYVNPG